jgi:hypothetical protein
MRCTTTFATVAVTALCSLLGNPADAAKSKSGRLTAMPIPGGRISTLVASADPDRIWAVNDDTFNESPTFWRSDDAGVHWTRLGAHARTNRLLFASPNHRDVLYATDRSPDRDGGGGVPIYRSDDGGATFARIDDGSLAETHVMSIAVDPASPATFYASGNLGTWVSHDGAISWRHADAQQGQLGSLLVDPGHPGRLWARTPFWSSIADLWTSDNGGVSWQAAVPPFTGPVGILVAGPAGSVAVAASPTNDNGGGNVFASHVFLTSNEGATWRDLGAPDTGSEIRQLAVEQGGQGRIWALVSRNLEQSGLEDRTRIFVRATADTSWHPFADAALASEGLVLLALPAQSGELLLATTGGIRRWDGNTWRRPEVEPAAQWVTALSTTTAASPEILVGTQADGTWTAPLAGGAASRFETPGDFIDATVTAVATVAGAATTYVALGCRGDGRCLGGPSTRVVRRECDGCAWQAADGGLPDDLTSVTMTIDPEDPNTVWAIALTTWTNHVWRTEDGGASWHRADDGLGDAFAKFLVIAPDEHRRVFIGTHEGTVLRWDPATEHWQTVWEHYPGRVDALAAGPGGLVYAGLAGGYREQDAGLIRSLDGGDTWTVLPTPFEATYGLVLDLAVSADAPDELWLAARANQGGLWRSRDRGEHFSLVIERDDLTEIATVPDHPGVVLVGTHHSGLLRWVDGCEPDAYTLCLDAGRIRVEGSWQNRYDGSIGRVRVRQQSDGTGVLAFSDLANPELIVKAIDLGRPRPEIFVGQLTDLDWQVRLTDTKTGERQVITNHDGACKPPEREVTSIAAETCIADARTLCLLDGRLRVRAIWDNQYDGSHGAAGALPFSPLASWLTFVDPALPELLLKALDFGDRTLLYWGALTDLGYRLTVDDLSAGVSRSYVNPPGQRCGGSDTWATPP